MATTIASSSSSEPPLEIPQWLKTLPLAPEFHPTQAEFQDPISYILKIEKQASNFGICKIVPPLPPPPRKAVVSNLNRSLSARNPNSQPTFTTRHQQIGFCPRRPRPVQRPVWQSGENYTIQEFETKAKQFERTHLKKSGKKGFSALEIETLFWKASVDKPFTVEYANDMPGSAFVPVSAKKSRETGDGVTVGDTAWNMRGVSRSNGSLLRFMKDEIPGVTSPMVYIAMLFSWFAWHVEDHDLHSLNYMHMGAAKTWYGVPRDAGFAFEDVVRVHGYGGEVNPLVTFATLGEKTTVMSPEVLIGAGIPCCRLVQNVGEFVVTFPGAYHSGFSHGFNCGEAANIATPEWLRFAKEAAIRRASINYPPMVSHFQLLYALALKLCSRVPTNICTEPRSSRLKEKRRGEGENIVKDLFVRDVIQNNELLHILLRQGRPCVLVPQNLSKFASPDIRSGSQRKVKPRLPLLCSNKEAHGVSRDLPFDGNELDRNIRIGHLTGFQSETGNSRSMSERERLASLSVSNDHCRSDELCTLNSMKKESDSEKESTAQGASLLEQGLFSCVTCGILSFACAAVIQPKEATARYFMSSDCSFFNDWNDGSGDQYAISNGNEDTSETNCNSGLIENSYQDGLYDVPVQSGEYQVQMADQEYQVQVTCQNNQAQVSDHQAQVADQNHQGLVADQKIDNLPHTGGQKNISSLDLLAFAYGNPSDSEEEQAAPEKFASASDIGGQKLSGYGDSLLHSPELHDQDGTAEGNSHSSSKLECSNEISACYSRQTSCYRRKPRCIGSNVNAKSQQISDCETDGETPVPEELNCLTRSGRDVEDLSTGSAEFYENDVYMEQILSDPVTSSTPVSLLALSKCSHTASFGDATKYYNVDVSIKNIDMSLVQRTDEATSKKHIFCLEHALEVEKQLRPLGGAHMLLLCHPDYSKVEEEAKLLTEELGIEYDWKHILFKEANQEELEIILSALDDEEALPGNGDWAVKMGINLYYSANLSRSPLYIKQMPYNAIIYKAFGCSSLENSLAKYNVSGKGSSKQKKIVVAGKWCGRVWMSNQVHPYLALSNMKERDSVGFHLQAAQNLEPSSKSERKVEVNKQIERVTASSLKPSPKLNREAKMSHQFGPLLPEKKSSSAVTTNMTRKRGQKRKSKIKNKATKSPKLSSLDNPFEATKTEDSSASDSPSLDVRILRSEQPKKPLFQGSSVRNICKRATKRPNLPLLDSPVEAEDSSESDTSSQDGRILRCEQPRMPLLRGINVRKTENRATNRPKSPSFFDPVDVTEAEDSSDSDTPSRGGRILRFEQHKMSLVRGISPRKIDNRATKRLKSPSFDSPVEVTEPEDSSESDSPSRGGKINKQQSKKPLLRGRSLKNIQQCGSNLQDETEGGPSTRLRRRPSKPSEVLKAKLLDQKPTLVSISKKSKEVKKAKKASVSCNDVQNEEAEYQCDVEGCTMGFSTKQELVLHKRNICSVRGCGKKFFSHKYLVQHRRVHIDDRPLKCPWKGCKMSFKWAWARTEHIRVHTGARPYVCHETGCGQTFRFVSDFSRHKRKTGHATKDRG